MSTKMNNNNILTADVSAKVSLVENIANKTINNTIEAHTLIKAIFIDFLKPKHISPIVKYKEIINNKNDIGK